MVLDIKREFIIRRMIGEESLRIKVDPKAIKCEIREFHAQKLRMKFLENPLIPKFMNRTLSKILWEMSKFELNETEVDRIPIEKTPVYRKMKNVFDHRKNLKESKLYQEISYQIEKAGYYNHKNYFVHSKDGIEDCIKNCFLDIIQSMDRDGYLNNKKRTFATGGIGQAFIDRDGSILRAASATHRLAAAKIVEMEDPFPIRIIGAHSDWIKRHNLKGISEIKMLPGYIKKVEANNLARTQAMRASA